MKRTAGAFMLLASLGGCMTADRKPAPWSNGQAAQAKKPSTLQGPYGEPIAYGNLPQTGMSPGLAPAGYVSGNGPKAGTNLIQAGYLEGEPDSYGGPAGRVPSMHHGKGIVPVPAGGPPGAVAAIGALPAYGPQAPNNMRTSVKFGSPDGMSVTWFGPNGWNDVPLRTPAAYNFLQGGVYRLKLSSVANRAEKVYYPTLEVVPASPKAIAYLAHSTAPVSFTDEDFEQVDSGNFLVKVVYLPDPNNQDLAIIATPNELISTRLEPGIDPIAEAQRRGTILLIVRMGNIDLNAPLTPRMDAPNPYMMQMAPRVIPQAMPLRKDDKLMPVPPPTPPMPKLTGKPDVLPTLP